MTGRRRASHAGILRGLAAVAAREILGLLAVPRGIVVAVLFLLLQGWNFSLLLHALNDPLAAPGPVMRYFFGGSFFVFWLPVAFVTSIVGMRLVAEERARGTFDLLLAAPVRPCQAILGKYVAALVYYGALWAPTVLFVVMLRGAGAEPDLGPVASGYLGAFVVGALCLAIATAASAASEQPLSAAAAAFVVIVALVLSGLWADEAPAGPVREVLDAANLLAFMQETAQGIVDAGRLAVYAAATAGALVLAVRWTDPYGGRDGMLRTVAILACLVAWAGIARRHLPRADWTSSRIYTVSDEATRYLAALDRDVRVDVLVPSVLAADQPNPLRRELDEVLRRMAARTDRLVVRFVDPDRDREEAEARIAAFGLSPADLVEGVVLVESGEPGRRRRVHLRAPDLVTYATGPDVAVSGPRVVAFDGEGALVRAFARVTRTRDPEVCITQGHGEPDVTSLAPYDGLAHFEDLLRDEGYGVRTVVSGGDAEGCDALVVAGPKGPLPEDVRAAVFEALDRGRGVALFAGAVLLRGRDRLADHGLEDQLARFGIAFGERVVLDPHARPGATPFLSFTLDEGWGEAAAVAHLVGRPVSFVLARELEVDGRAAAPVPEVWFSAPESSWAEADLAALREGRPVAYDEGADRRGPIPLVVATSAPGGGRLVVVSSDQILLNAHLRPDLVYDATRDLVRAVVAHVADAVPVVGIEARPRESIKLVLRPEQLRRMTLMAWFGPAGLYAAAGLFVVWGRRRAR